MQLSPVQIAIVVYAAIFFILASSMETQNIGLGYHFVYIGTSMVAQLLVVAGIFLFALNVSEHYFTLWRWIFPLLILELAVGLYFDLTIPADSLGGEWVSNLAFSVWFVVPAYYFNFQIARYGSKDRDDET